MFKNDICVLYDSQHDFESYYELCTSPQPIILTFFTISMLNQTARVV